MAYKFSITNVNKVKINGVLSVIEAEITCTNLDNNRTSKVYLSVSKNEVPSFTVQNVLQVIKNKLTQQQTHIDENGNVVIDQDSIVNQMKKDTADPPVITKETDNTFLTDLNL